MKTKRLISVVLIAILIRVAGFAQRNEIRIPDIPGYQTLKCDFHMHTVFSDGLVWPTIRVQEAFREGLDAISITDHIEYQPHKEYVKGDHNRSYELASKAAADAGIILIKGTEITRSLPVGHYNALFIQDANELDHPDFFTVVERAIGQGAFIIWNHPGWTQPGEIPIWYEEQEKLHELGWMHGMEIVNYTSYYPLAQSWCTQKNITQVGCSDIHGTMEGENLAIDGANRPLTLVFATEHSEKGIRDALFAGRTAVYFGQRIFGKEEWLAPLADAMLEVKFVNGQTESQATRVWLTNHSEFRISLNAPIYPDGIVGPAEILVEAGQTASVHFRSEKEIADWRTTDIRFSVDNMHVDAGLPLQISLLK